MRQGTYRLARIKARNASGRLVTATEITTRKTRLVVLGVVGPRKAAQLLKKYEPALDHPTRTNPGPRPQGLKKSLARFRQFNREPARTLKQLAIPDDAPLIRIGKVPALTYISRKSGRVAAYEHATNPDAMPTAYAHPTKPFLLIVGGTLKVRDWLYN